MTTQGLFDLFGYVFDGIRGAGNRGDAIRAKHEIDLAIRMLAAIKGESPIAQFSEAIEQYQYHSKAESHEIMKLSADRYGKLIRLSGNVTSKDLERAKMPYFDALSEILRVGLTFAQAANAVGNYPRVEVEADHLHNIPTYLTSDTNRTLDYYLETEQPFYLDRIERYFGKQNRMIAEQSFGPHWKAIMSAA
ncbi:MAG: hypothetical protein ACO1RA_07725 [Planctomycetaceae bacterium]